MNIFEVLSRGKSRLHEPSISAMLGYLLSPTDDHGLNDSFLRAFLLLLESKIGEPIFREILSLPMIRTTVTLEEPYKLGENNRRDIDVQVSLYNSSSSKELHRIIIENKIKSGAANPQQLYDNYLAVTTDEGYQTESPQLTVVFITPHIEHLKFTQEYELLLTKKREKTPTAWIYWYSTNVEETTIVTLIRTLLVQELHAEIYPINEYMRQTLKAFVCHLVDILEVEKGTRKNRVGEDIGDLFEESTFTMKSGETYRIVRRDSDQIQLFDAITDEKVVARPILRQYLAETGILSLDKSWYTTRQYGKWILDYLLGRKSISGTEHTTA